MAVAEPIAPSEAPVVDQPSLLPDLQAFNPPVVPPIVDPPTAPPIGLGTTLGLIGSVAGSEAGNGNKLQEPPKPQLPPVTPEKPKGPEIGESSRQKYGGLLTAPFYRVPSYCKVFSIFWKYTCLTTHSYYTSPTSNHCWYVPIGLSSFAVLAVIGAMHGPIGDVVAGKINFKSLIF